jgi:hypothetical protein
LLLEVNSNIGAEAEDLPAEERETRSWEFVCECGAGDCREQVRLTLAGYEQLRATDGFVLAGTHTMRRAELARAWARTLAGEAAALRAQASHQRQRARKSLGRWDAPLR